MKLSTVSFLMFVVMASTAFAQQHVPSFTTSGQIVTFDAELVFITPAPKYLIDGWKLIDNSTLFGTQSNSIRLFLEYDVAYAVNMMGRPEDPAAPNRAFVVDTVTITASQEDLIRHYWSQKGVSDAFFKSNSFGFDVISDALKSPLER